MRKMKISITYLPEYRKALSEVDYVEFNGFPLDEKLITRLKKSWLFHLRRTKSGKRPNFSSPEVVKESKDELIKFFESSISLQKPKIVSYHFGYSCEEIGKTKKDEHNYALSDILSKREVEKRFIESLEVLSYFSKTSNIKIAVENMDYNDGGAYEYVCEPDFINKLLKKFSNIYLVLDIAHAEISANKLGYEKYTYLFSLPLERVIEVHLSSPDEEHKKDMHLPLREEEIKTLKELLSYLGNLEVINLEYKPTQSSVTQLIKDIKLVKEIICR